MKVADSSLVVAAFASWHEKHAVPVYERYEVRAEVL